MELDQHSHDVYKLIIFWKPSDYQESLIDDYEENSFDMGRQGTALRDCHLGHYELGNTKGISCQICDTHNGPIHI